MDRNADGGGPGETIVLPDAHLRLPQAAAKALDAHSVARRTATLLLEGSIEALGQATKIVTGLLRVAFSSASV